MPTRLYLDTRSVNAQGEAPVKVSINMAGRSVYISTGIKVLPAQWDRKSGKVTGNRLKERLNLDLAERKMAVDRILADLKSEGLLHGISLSDVRCMVLDRLDPEKARRKAEENLFMARFDAWTRSKKKKGTRITYEQTAKKIRAFDPNADSLAFESITNRWLHDFDEFMAKTAPNANSRSIHMRNIRTVINEAIKDEITNWYPFKRFRIAGEVTKNRSLSREELQRLFSFQCGEYQQEAQDMFRLIFLLAGINIGDLAAVKSLSSGYIDWHRAKTGQPISLSVLPEAALIIKKYAGKGYLLNISERYRDYRDYAHRINDKLKRIGQVYNPHTKKWEGEALLPDISIYWARYSWASIAAELDIPERTIDAALAHSTKKSVASIYIRTDMRRKIEEAQRKVADYIFNQE
ncbi:MAG: site-specific integrase [Bacteroidales bacterium]|nr:site-specific integrase [Candidatus Egerieousia equi]